MRGRQGDRVREDGGRHTGGLIGFQSSSSKDDSAPKAQPALQSTVPTTRGRLGLVSSPLVVKLSTGGSQLQDILMEGN